MAGYPESAGNEGSSWQARGSHVKRLKWCGQGWPRLSSHVATYLRLFWRCLTSGRGGAGHAVLNLFPSGGRLQPWHAQPTCLKCLTQLKHASYVGVFTPMRAVEREMAESSILYCAFLCVSFLFEAFVLRGQWSND